MTTSSTKSYDYSQRLMSAIAAILQDFAIGGVNEDALISAILFLRNHCTVTLYGMHKRD